jgi:NADH-quinone oxidoreductase subunit N
MALLLAGAVAGEKGAPAIGWGAILLLALAGAATVTGPNQASAFHDAFIADGFSRFAKLLILGGSAFSILLADEFFSDIKLSRFELPVLMLLPPWV